MSDGKIVPRITLVIARVMENGEALKRASHDELFGIKGEVMYQWSKKEVEWLDGKRLS